MSFHSISFLIFLVVFLVVYWRLTGSRRQLFCLSASYFFYGWWDYRFLGLLVLSTLVDFSIALAIERSTNQSTRRALLLVSVATNLGILATFKYFDFFTQEFLQLTDQLGWHVDWPTFNLVLPLGISFYTFQTLSYSIDVYRGTIAAERSLLRFANYVTFFPQLVAGPIVRASEFLPQLQSDRRWSFENMELGLGLVFLGYFKKVVIADNIGLVVDNLFENPAIYTAVNALVVIVLYAFQIYSDFSGYSDIAIGIALMLGFVFPVNFRFPYFADSFDDFWRRWHITLSTWLRDYVYIPLGGNRRGRWVTTRNLMLTMLLGGLWHGANWTFIVWGAIHGTFLILQRFCSWSIADVPKRSSGWIVRIISAAFVFTVVSLAWVVFRSDSGGQAIAVFERLIQLDGFHPSTLHNRIPLLKCCTLVVILVGGELAVFVGLWSKVQASTWLARPLGYASLLWMIALFGSFHGQTFIYFQF